MIYIGIASITPTLAACAMRAISATTPEPHRVIVNMANGSHGAKLDHMFRTLPGDAEYFFTMDDDAAPLKRGWLTWTLEKFEGWYRAFGDSMVVGCLYHVAYLRRPGGFNETRNPGDLYRDRRIGAHVARTTDVPWWLRNCEAFRDDAGDLVFAHLGGGTVGHTWRVGAKLYPRIPRALWPVMVRRHLERTA